MSDKFTVEEIKRWILSEDSLGDVMYNCNAERIKQANDDSDNDDTEW